MIDTHTHIYLPEFDADRTEVINRALAVGVEQCILPNIDVDSIDALMQVQNDFPRYTHVAMGLHPTSVDADYKQQLSRIERALAGYSYCAIGEIGIDLYWDTTYRKEQLDAFACQLKWAAELNLPVIIHQREAFQEVMQVLHNCDVLPAGVFHSFTGSVEQVAQIKQLGDFYFGINGIITFKKSALPAVLPHIGIERILLETDAPYLAPTPYRGKRNEPSYLPYTALGVADALNRDIADVRIITTHNARTLFSLPKPESV